MPTRRFYDDEKPLDMAGRRNLHAHPVTGQLIAQRERSLSPVIATAIAQHHETAGRHRLPPGPGRRSDQPSSRRILMLVRGWRWRCWSVTREQPRITVVAAAAVEPPQLRHQACPRSCWPRCRAWRWKEGDTPANGPEHEQVASLIDAWPKLRAFDAAGRRRATRGIHRSAPRPVAPVAGRRRPGRSGKRPRWPPATSRWCCAGDRSRWAREALWHARQIAYEALHRWPELALTVGAAASSAAGEWIAMGLREQASTGMRR